MTKGSFCVYDIIAGGNESLHIPGCVRGMVYLEDQGEIIVGTSYPDPGKDNEMTFFVTIKLIQHKLGLPRLQSRDLRQSPAHYLNLPPLSSTLVDKWIVCTIPESGVQVFDTTSYNWIDNPPLLGTAISVAVLSNRNLVVQTKASIQIFAMDVLKGGDAYHDGSPPYIYPLGDKHIVHFQPNMHPTLLELETLRELCPDNNSSPSGSFPADQPTCACVSFGCGLVGGFSVSMVMEAWQSGTKLPRFGGALGADPSLPIVLSPKCTRFVRVAHTYSNPRQISLYLIDTKHRITLAIKRTEHGDFENGEVYDLVFDSETRFYLKIDGPGWHVQIPYDIIDLVPPFGEFSHAMVMGKPEKLSEPRETPPYTLDENYEWVLDAKSRKICWVPPGNLRRGYGAHFWAGLSLVVVGGDSVVTKLTFKEPDC